MAGLLTKTMSPAYMAYDKIKEDNKEAPPVPVATPEDEMMTRRKRIGERRSAAGMLAEGEKKSKKASAMLTEE
jgi:hypothetical protein